MKNMIYKYIRDEKRNPVGVAVVIKTGDNYRFGYSLCNPQEQFNRELGLRIATNRANLPTLQKDEALAPLVPDRRSKVLDTYCSLEIKASKYFKTPA